MHRRTFLALATGVAAVSLALGGASSQELPKLKQKDTYKVGFAQTESNNPWRIAQTESMQDEAAKLGYQLVYTDAAGSAAKQVADVNSMIAQGVDLIFLAPREEKPLIPAVMAAKKAGIPVILLDRNVDQTLAKAGRGLRHLHRLGLHRGRPARRPSGWSRPSNGKAKIIELEGTTGSLAGQRPQEGLRRLRSRTIPAWRSSPPSPATSPATRAGRSPRRCCRRIPTRQRSTPTTTRWRWAPSRRSRPPARCRART